MPPGGDAAPAAPLEQEAPPDSSSVSSPSLQPVSALLHLPQVSRHLVSTCYQLRTVPAHPDSELERQLAACCSSQTAPCSNLIVLHPSRGAAVPLCSMSMTYCPAAGSCTPQWWCALCRP